MIDTRYIKIHPRGIREIGENQDMDETKQIQRHENLDIDVNGMLVAAVTNIHKS